jgi:hypothetical protein
MFESWGEIPVALLQHMDWRNSLYGYIGIEDRTLYPMLRPGSFVKIDSQQTNVLNLAAGTTNSSGQSTLWSFEITYMCAVGAM